MTKVILCIFFIALGIYLLFDIFSPNLSLNKMEVFTFILAFATIFLAIASFLNIKTSNETLNIMRDDSLLVNRPYVFLEKEGRWNLEDDNIIKFTINIKNSGKSSAEKLSIDIDQAVILENKDIGNEIRDFDISKVSKENIAEIIGQPFDVIHTIYPEQALPNTLPRIRFKDLKKKIFNEKKALYLRVSVSYYGLSFKNKQIKYCDEHYMVFAGWEDSQGKLQGSFWWAYSKPCL